MSENEKQDNVLLRAEFNKADVPDTENPLLFIAHEVAAIIERGVPPNVQLAMSYGRRIVVTVEVQ